MELLLWRHAEAEDGDDDMQRRLTRRGQAQARRMAAWLGERLPAGTRIIVSPAARAQQTARALRLPFETRQDIGPGAGAAELLAAAGWPKSGSAALLVGHQPALGHLACWLLTGREADWSVKKAALWWFSSRLRDGERHTTLRAAMSVELLGPAR